MKLRYQLSEHLFGQLKTSFCYTTEVNNTVSYSGARIPIKIFLIFTVTCHCLAHNRSMNQTFIVTTIQCISCHALICISTVADTTKKTKKQTKHEVQSLQKKKPTRRYLTPNHSKLSQTLVKYFETIRNFSGTEPETKPSTPLSALSTVPRIGSMHAVNHNDTCQYVLRLTCKRLSHCLYCSYCTAARIFHGCLNMFAIMIKRGRQFQTHEHMFCLSET